MGCGKFVLDAPSPAARARGAPAAVGEAHEVPETPHPNGSTQKLVAWGTAWTCRWGVPWTCVGKRLGANGGCLGGDVGVGAPRHVVPLARWRQAWRCCKVSLDRALLPRLQPKAGGEKEEQEGEEEE